ncbi:MAG: RHS repeat-associated core domain-containing protein [Flavobacteriales bacterium]|nr:RHS repeat-associated core domain-containing protein [Flavobacteriales bacterium]
MNRIQLFLILLLASTSTYSQVIGGRENSESTPKVAEATQLSGGGFVGDVNAMTGEFQASIPLGSVSTPAGLGFSLSLNHSSSFAFSNNQPMTAGIPYGDGWSPNIPTISIETDVFRKYSCSELKGDGGVTPTNSDLNFNKSGDEFTGTDEGDLYWFSPIISIPGVISGRAVFKYVDVDDNRCLVFVLNKFETPVEIRYYGNSWTVKLADGTKYNFTTHLANYRAPSNQRAIMYDQLSDNSSDPDGYGLAPGDANPMRDVVIADNYLGLEPVVQNVIEPKQSYSVWHCDLIYNQNTPLQGVRFVYEKFGKFNYFEEFNQTAYQGVRTEVFNAPTNTDFSAYSDVFLSKVNSYVMESPLDIIELDYKTYSQAITQPDQVILDHINDPEVMRKDSLYSYKTVRSWGDENVPSTLDFDNWKRYQHIAASPPEGNANFSQVNPYLSASGIYQRESVGNGVDDLPFDHGFLESDRLFENSNLFPGDVYEIKTRITRPNGQDLGMGNGTIDIVLRTGTLDNSPSNENNTFTEGGLNYPSSDYEETRGVELFSTFNSALKWQMSYNQSAIETSNTFVMPNVPGSYHGFHIAVGPGNSDIDFGASVSNPYYGLINPLVSGNVPNALVAYPFNSNQRPIKSTAQIPHNFGTGHPWSMMIPIYNQMAINPTSVLGGAGNPEDPYKTWWATANEINNNTRDNIPTKFDNSVELDKVELIRYSKNAYMLQGVRVYKVNGDYTHKPNGEITGRELVTQKRLEYRYKNEALIRNYDYSGFSQAPALRKETNYNRRIILLDKVREVPLTVEELDFYKPDFNFTNSDDTSKVLTTFLGYKKILDNVNLNSTEPLTYDILKPWQGISQYVLDTYIDHLGGITKVEYYPFGGNGETRFSTTYIFNACNNYITHEAIGKNRSYTGHLAVRYLGKNDESNSFTPNQFIDPFNTNYINKVWEYQYDVTSTIFNPKKIIVPGANFRAQYMFANDVAFGKVRVISPSLPSGEYTYTDYEYYGNTDPMNQPSIDDFLLYGKLKKAEVRDNNDVLHSEIITSYDYTLAFENAYKRPNPMREKLGYDDLFTRSYEYEDIYKNEVLTMDITSPSGITSTLVGPATYSSLDVPYLNGNYSDREQPKFMEFWFYNELVTSNPDFFFDSYFIKKTSEIQKVYDNSLEKNNGISNPVITQVDDKDTNPFGSGFVNPIADDPVNDDPLMLSVNEQSSPGAALAMINASPLSDTVLVHVNQSFMKQGDKASVLAAQGGLSNKVWKSIIDYRGSFNDESLDLMMNTQAYITDEIQIHLIDNFHARDNYRFAADFLLKNPYLSEPVVLEMTDPTIAYPEETFGRIIGAQSQLSAATLSSILSSEHLKDVNLLECMSDQVLTDAHWTIILSRSELENTTILTLIEQTPAFPSDNTLLAILDHSPSFGNRGVERIFNVSNRAVSTSIEAKLYTNYPEVADNIVNRPFTGNPLAQYCNNDVIEGRKYIETKTEYDYYEADYKGRAIGVAHEMLLGHRSDVDDPSPYPFTVDASNFTSQFSDVVQVNNLRLKHEPSWQVYSVKTSSPQLPGAYNREEYYYLYDLQNRYDRYWYNYDLESNNFHLQIYDEFPSFFSPDTTAFNYNWASDYSDQTHPKLPQFDGMERSRTYGNRVLAFQKTVVSKNTRDQEAIVRSEYFDYDRRWRFNDLPGEIEIATFNGDSCPTAPPIDNGPCDGLMDCTDCYNFHYTTDQMMQTLVPLGHCAYWSPVYGWFICPQGSNVSNYAPNAMAMYCNLGVPSSESPAVNPLIVATPKALPAGDALAKTLLLRSVTIQLDSLDHSTNQEFAGIKMDSKNVHVAEFQLGNFTDMDADNFEMPYEMIYPYDHLTVRTILERNRYLQTALEENQVGLQTKYYYNSSQTLWNTNANCTNPDYAYLYNYLSTVNEDIAQPVRIAVGYNKTDSLSTAYQYNSIGQVQKVTEPSGKFLEYTFDDYHRMISVAENGNRQLTENEYFNWNHEFNDAFADRIDNNYVQTILFNSDPALDPDELDRETRKAFLDPLGRNHSVVTGYSLDPLNHVEIHSGTVEYDNWGRVIKAYKNYREDITSLTTGAPKINSSNNTTNPYAETIFENDAKARPLRSSNYDVDVASVHAVKTAYHLVNDIYASCELNLNASELQLVLGPNGTSNYLLIRSEILDQDNKKSVDYINVFGQKVATLKYNDNNQRVVTLFGYDSYGNLVKVINPEKQENTFEYNILGQLVKETSVDAGTKRYMYNKQGLVSISLDEQGQFYDPNGNGVPGDPANGTTNAFYRVFKYDDFGRALKIGRSYVPYDYSLNQEIPFLQYKTTAIGDIVSGVPESGDMSANGRYLNYEYSNISSQDWLATFDAWSLAAGGGGGLTPQVVTISGFENLYINVLEKEIFYGGDVTSNEIGKITKTYSYNNDGMKVQRIDNIYDDNDNLLQQVIAFNHEMDVDVSANNINSTIDYPKYNYRNSLLEEKVDVNGDGTIDFHCYMEYDALNRLSNIYGAAGLAPTKANATLLVSYEYDDANGLIAKKTHHIDNGSLSVLANEIAYQFDSRDRLTNIQAGLPTELIPLMDYKLFYDDQIPMYVNGTVETVNHTNNWNGNINGTTMNYDFLGIAVTNPISQTSMCDETLLYGYTYDKINRLVDADATVADFLQTGVLEAESRSVGDVKLSYDRIGNIKSLHRTFLDNSGLIGAPYSEIQHWNYTYAGGTNRLTQVDGLSGTTSRNYSYDANGNLLTDDSKNLDQTSYGRAAYPFELTIDGEPTTYLYSVNDMRTYKKVVTSTETTEDYYLMDGMGKTVAIFHKSNSNAGWEYFVSGSERECRLTPDGNQTPVFNTSNTDVTFNENQASFFLYDHLGNTRMTYTPINFVAHPGDPTVAEIEINTVVDYFPYGKILRELENGDKERYLSTQHERDQEIGLDYRGARYYDSEVSRFLSLDPKARDYPSLSNYIYVADNPIAFIDPDGKKFVIPNEEQREQVLGMLNTYSQHTYTTNDKGEIYVSEWNTNENGSEYFSDRFQQAMNSSNTTEIIIHEQDELPLPWTRNGWLTRGILPKVEKPYGSNETGYISLKSQGEGLTVIGRKNGGAKNNLVYISGESYYTFYQDEDGNISGGGLASAAEILLHELIGHAIPAMIGSDTGNAIENENKVWKEVHTTIRWVDPSHKEIK